MRHFKLLLALVNLSATAAIAGETPWQEVSPGVKLRLISSGQVEAGQTLLGLEIDMPDTNKTYWRIPGEAGIATEIDFSGSTGVEGGAIAWPHPTVQADGYTDFVYFGHTVLPISVKATASDPVAAVSALLGICSDICMPVKADFRLPLVDGKKDRANALRLRQALADVPMPWQEQEQPIGDVTLDATGNALAIHVESDVVDISTLIAATHSGTPLFGAPQKSRQEDLVLLPILGKTENSALQGQEVQLSFMTGMGAFELRRNVEVAPGTR